MGRKTALREPSSGEAWIQSIPLFGAGEEERNRNSDKTRSTFDDKIDKDGVNRKKNHLQLLQTRENRTLQSANINYAQYH